MLLIASSDMNDYESDEVTRRKDSLALERLLALDPRGLYDVVRSASITMCGVGPAVRLDGRETAWRDAGGVSSLRHIGRH